MTVLRFHLQRSWSLKKFFGASSFKDMLGQKWSVSLSGGGQTQRSTQTSWGNVPPDKIVSFLKDYRHRPGSAKADEDLRNAFHSFLFPERGFDTAFGGALPRASSIIIEAAQDDRMFIANMPWELADGVRLTEADNWLPTSTLAALPLARTLTGTQNVALNVGGGRLRVLSAIADPDQALDGEAFRTALGRSLSDRAGFVDHIPLGGKGQGVRVSDLIGAIEGQVPHVLIVVAHGKTEKGESSLYFGNWEPVRTIVTSVARKRGTLLVLLIACDQTNLETHSAQSGAVAFLEAGIPFVVGMQSSVRASLAGIFLGALIDGIFRIGSVPKATGAARISMAPNARAAKEGLDWSFPALFVTEDFPGDEAFAPIVKNFSPGLEQLLRKIPPPEPYLSRPELERELDELIVPTNTGVRYVTGHSGSGKTSVLSHACRAMLLRMVRSGDASGRPLLYVDLSRHDRSGDGAYGLWAAIRRETSEAQGFADSTILSWPALKGSGGAGASEDVPSQWVAGIDRNRMVLVLDNVSLNDDPEVRALATAASGLARSLVVVVTEPTGVDNALIVKPFDVDETLAYAKTFAPQATEQDARRWFELTGGFPVLLNDLRRNPRAGTNNIGNLRGNHISENILGHVSLLMRNLSDKALDLVYELTHLSGGVNAELGWGYVPGWSGSDELLNDDLLLRDYRFGLSDFWVRLPKLIAAALVERAPEKAAEAGNRLSEFFTDVVGRDGPENVEGRLLKVVTTAGGLDFLHDIHRVLLQFDKYREVGRALPDMLHEWLLQRGKWYDAYRFWKRSLDVSVTAFEETAADQWLKFAKAAHVLGLGTEAAQMVANARSRELSPLDEVDCLDMESLLIKDSAQLERFDEVMEKYERALHILDDLLRVRVDEAEFDSAHVKGKRAAVLYNRALMRGFWRRCELDGALSDLGEARRLYSELGISNMLALSEVEAVDLQLRSDYTGGVYEQMLTRLFAAERIFEHAANRGDRAFCVYQMARCYGRLGSLGGAANDAWKKSADAYQQAAELARQAGDVRQDLIAQVHIVEVGWQKLGRVNSADAAQKLGDLAGSLSAYGHDAWASRVRRDSLVLHALAVTGDSARGRAILHEAWRVSTTAPLHPEKGTDARRAVAILVALIEILSATENNLEGDRLLNAAKDLLKIWLGREINPLRPEDFLEELRRFSAVRTQQVVKKE